MIAKYYEFGASKVCLQNLNTHRQDVKDQQIMIQVCINPTRMNVYTITHLFCTK